MKPSKFICQQLLSPIGVIISMLMLYITIHDDYYHWKISPSDIEKVDAVCGVYKGVEYIKRRHVGGYYSYAVDQTAYRFLFGGRDVYHKYLRGLVGERVCFYYYDELYSDSVLKYLFYFESDGRRYIDQDFSIASYMEYKNNGLYGISFFFVLFYLAVYSYCCFSSVRELNDTKHSK
jgi:hypothetical protein